MKRRAFLRFLGGAAASGPTLANSLSAEAATGLAGNIPYGVGSIASGGSFPTSDADWRTSRIAELKAIISGESKEQQHGQRMHRLYSLEAQERYRLDSLRSVSPSARHRMLTEGASSRSRRIEVADAEFSLIRFLSGN